MSKHKKRVSLAQRPDESAAPPGKPAAVTSADQTATPQTEPTLETVDELEQDVAEEDQDIAESQPGMESQPLFWFLLGALTVGIIVLLGLLVLTPAKASPRPTATVAVIRPATQAPTPRNAEPTGIPNIEATMTAVMERNLSVVRVSAAETLAKLNAGTAIVVDVRSAQSYADMHIKGAINIPESETEARLAEIPRDKEIILYCT
jgi:hypothetical protein